MGNIIISPAFFFIKKNKKILVKKSYFCNGERIFVKNTQILFSVSFSFFFVLFLLFFCLFFQFVIFQALNQKELLFLL